MGFPGDAVVNKEPPCQCRKHKRLRLDPWVRKVPWKGKATHSSILAWRVPWTVWSMGLQRVGHN